MFPSALSPLLLAAALAIAMLSTAVAAAELRDLIKKSPPGSGAAEPLQFKVLSFTSAKCRRLLVSLRVADFPDKRVHSNSPAAIIPASSITLNVPTNQQACSQGKLKVVDESVPFYATRSSKPFSLFLRVVKELFPIRYMSYADGVVSKCPVSVAKDEPTDETITTVVFFTRDGNDTKLTVPAGETSRDLFIATLAEDVMYVAIGFAEAEEEGDGGEKAEAADAGSTAPPPVDFFCILASDAPKAELAAEAGRKQATDKKKVNDKITALAEARRDFTAGEVTGISLGSFLALVGIVGLFISRRKKRSSRVPLASVMPRGL